MRERVGDRLDGVLAQAILARNGGGSASAPPEKLSPAEEFRAKKAAAEALRREMATPVPKEFALPNRPRPTSASR